MKTPNMHPACNASAPQPLANLASFRLRRLTNMYTKATSEVYEEKFGLSLNQWRILALLSSTRMLSLSRLAQQAQFDRGLTSRVVTELIGRELLTRTTDPNDSRGVLLALSAKGEALIAQVAPIAWDRNQMLLSCLTQREIKTFETILDKLTQQARAMLDSPACGNKDASIARPDDDDR